MNTHGSCKSRLTFRYPLVLGLILAGTAAQAAGKVTVCHYPPGNPSKSVELVVAAPAVPDHVAHGDYVGPCGQDCRRNAVLCKDSSACTTDTCDPSGNCVHAALSCDDSAACTTDTCDDATGCHHAPVVCNDGNQCTGDSCDPRTGACVFTGLSCDDGQGCTTDSCDPIAGCRHEAVVCDDGSQCTTEACDPNTGTCESGMVSCDDVNACTADSCTAAGGCQHTPISCDDQSACTTDSCTATGGCAHSTVSCDDSNQCTTDSCDAASGCAHTIRSCDDGNSCTVDSCSPATGCTHAPVTCSAGSTCNPSTGGCVALDFTFVQSFSTNCIPFNYQDLIDNVPSSITTYNAAYTYCGLLCINDPGHGGCNQLWVAYTDPATKAGPYWCLYGAGPQTSNFDWHWTSSEIQCSYTPIPKYADWYSRP